MSTLILGISAFYHDSAAAILRDGVIVAAAQEERFTRKKHDHHFPQQAIDFCLKEAGAGPQDLNYVVFYEKPLVKFERLMETYLSYAPAGFQSFIKALPQWVGQKLRLRGEIRRGLRGRYTGPIVFTEHHESHAASAFFPSPFREAAILTLDGVGEWTTTSFGVGRGNRIELTHELRFPHSLGLLYSAFTYFTGFRVNSGEYKLMGLAPYGKPVYKDAILKHLLDLKDDGSFRLNMEYFNYCQGLTMTGHRFADLFGGPPRQVESPVTQREMDLAASIQAVTEEVMLRMARYIRKLTGMSRLVLAGGVALNCVGNGRILAEGIFDDLWIQPAAGDAGGALGAALFVWHQLLDKPRHADDVHDFQSGSLLGPASSSQDVRTYLDRVGARYHAYPDEAAWADTVSDLIAQEKVVGLVQGRMEFGPRALGCRSIIGDARSRQMQSVMNLKIKFRESFRPFAPIVLRDHVHEWFAMRPGQDSPYMLLVAPVIESRRLAIQEQDTHLFGIDLLNVARSVVPAITHVDYSARIQTVDSIRHGRLHRLMTRFHEKTSCPVMINTSFNIRGEPIVCGPEQAYRCFLATDMDALVLEDCVLLKEEQPKISKEEVDRYLSQFALD